MQNAVKIHTIFYWFKDTTSQAVSYTHLDVYKRQASNDLQQATNIARQMITKYGFSERLGPVVYGTSQEETFLGRDFTRCV